MECHEIQELILESFEAHASNAVQRRDIEAHLPTCAECSRFAAVQHALDERLTTLLMPAPAIRLASRGALRARIQHESAPTRVRRDTLPEIVHFGSFAAATVAMIAVLPLSPSIVAGVGVTLALGSYVLLSAIRETFDESALGVDA
jgi:hypothetical protein